MSADGLLAILREGQALAAEDEYWRQLSCPNDGTPYVTGMDGTLRCTFDGYSPGVVTAAPSP